MFIKCLLLSLIGLLFLGASPQIVFAQSNTGNSDERNRIERIKTNVYRLENSGKTKIVVRLKSGAKLKGYLTKINEDTFDVTNYKTNQTTAIAYRDVVQVKPQGSSSKATKYVLGIAGVAAIVVLVLTLPRGGSGICPLGCGPF